MTEFSPESRADAKLKRLPEELRRQIWLMRNPQDVEDKKFTMDELVVWLRKEHQVQTSTTAMHSFLPWLDMWMRMDMAKDRAAQASEEIAKDPNSTPESVARVGQMVFTSEMVNQGNVKAFVELERIRLQAISLENENRKLKLLESKAARLDELEAKAKELKQGGGLSAETLEMLEKQLKIL